MKISNLFAFAAAAVAILLPSNVNSQAESIENSCKAYFNHPYIVTGRPYKALLTGDEVAEFRATLFSGTTYRIAVGNADKNNVIFSVYDIDHNLQPRLRKRTILGLLRRWLHGLHCRSQIRQHHYQLRFRHCHDRLQAQRRQCSQLTPSHSGY